MGLGCRPILMFGVVMNRLACSVVLCAFVAGSAAAAESPTLRKIKETGSITLGHRESSIPFSYYDDKQQVVGYAQEMMQKVVEAIKAELRLGKLDIRLMPVTSANRVPLIQNGTIDLECGSTTHTLERQKQVAFSTTFFIVGTRLLTRKDSGIHDFSDLPGRTVVSTAGSTSERLLRRLNEDKRMGMNILFAKDHGESFRTLESGKAAAYMLDDALLYGEMAQARRPADWVVVGTPQSKEAYGCIMRKEDTAFKRVVDAAITKVLTSGEAERMYVKWFQSPIPPQGLNLNLPLSDDMKALFKAPNDQAFE